MSTLTNSGHSDPDVRQDQQQDLQGLSTKRSKFAALVVRPLVLAFVFTSLVFAVIQATGRVFMASLHLFEPDLNGFLAQQNIKLSNLQGGWQGFNPTVRLDSLETPQAQVGSIYAELDLLESIWRNDLVARAIRIESLTMQAEKSAQGWTLVGFGGENPFDPTVLLRHSDALDGTARLQLVDPADPDSGGWISAQVSVRNLRLTHQLSLTLTSSASDDAAQEYQLQMLAHESRDVFWEDVSRQEFTLTGALKIPDILTGGSAVEVEPSRLEWTLINGLGEGGGRLLGRAETAFSPQPVGFTLQLGALSEGRQVEVTADAEISLDQDRLDVTGIHARIDTSQIGSQGTPDLLDLVTAEQPEPMVRVWLDEFDLGAFSTFIAAHFSSWDPAGRWISELAVQGYARNVHAFVDRDGVSGYGASVFDLKMTGYKGAPTLDGGQGEVWGHAGAVAMRLNAQDMFVQFPDLFHQGWDLEYMSGVVQAFFGPGYFALRGDGLKTQIGESSVAGQFSLTRPNPKYDQRVGLILNVDQADLIQAKSFVPYKIPEELSRWIATGPRAGRLSDARFVYQGQVHNRPNELGRRIELRSNVHDALVQYQASWPLVSEVDAAVHVAGQTTRVVAQGGYSMSIDITGSEFALRENGRFVDGTLRMEGQGPDLLAFVRNSPLQQNLAFIEDDWQMNGRVKAQGPMTIPLREDAPDLAASFEFVFEGVDLVLPGYRSELQGLDGEGQFALPHHLTGQFSGTMFDRRTDIQAGFSDKGINFDLQGAATPEDVYHLIAFEDSVPVAGQFSYSGRLHLPMADASGQSSGLPGLHVESDLVGLQIDLPGEFGKAPEEPTPAILDVQFLPDYQAVRWEYQSTHGWLHFAEELQRGAVGIATAPPMTSSDTQAIVISGHMPRIVLSDWVSDDGEASVGLPLDWDIRNLTVDEFVIDELTFESLDLSGSQVGDNVWFSFEGEDLAGSVELPDGQMMQIALSRLRLPASEEVDAQALVAEAEPVAFLIGPELGQTLPESQVRIDELLIADEPFGQWEFGIRPVADETGTTTQVNFVGFSTTVNGVNIENASLSWELQNNISAFDGRLVLDDLETTLPLWDYPPAMSTDTAALTFQGRWQGSPIDISLLGLEGDIRFKAEDGRFRELDAGAGGLRMLSLVNFSKAAKRFSFDFSDVVGEGISFDELSAKVSLNEGHLTFVDRMRLSGSSGNYELGGQIDLAGGILDNEMIVTLPVSNSLPWYGVYLALANPLAGLGVVVGERVLRKPLEQFSSAKFSVTGSLDDPQVNFVSLWDKSMRETGFDDPTIQSPAIEASSQAADPEVEVPKESS
ncbi:MAG: AsmA-like C-terminal region-containing protein [Pseudomonadota bacterium]